MARNDSNLPVLGLIFLRFAEVRFAAQRAKLESPSEQTGTPLYIIKDGHVVDLNRQAGGSYVLRAGHSGK